jgi:hypothetical protein
MLNAQWPGHADGLIFPPVPVKTRTDSFMATPSRQRIFQNLVANDGSFILPAQVGQNHDFVWLCCL